MAYGSTRPTHHIQHASRVNWLGLLVAFNMHYGLHTLCLPTISLCCWVSHTHTNTRAHRHRAMWLGLLEDGCEVNLLCDLRQVNLLCDLLCCATNLPCCEVNLHCCEVNLLCDLGQSVSPPSPLVSPPIVSGMPRYGLPPPLAPLSHGFMLWFNWSSPTLAPFPPHAL